MARFDGGSVECGGALDQERWFSVDGCADSGGSGGEPVDCTYAFCTKTEGRHLFERPLPTFVVTDGTQQFGLIAEAVQVGAEVESSSTKSFLIREAVPQDFAYAANQHTYSSWVQLSSSYVYAACTQPVY
jgi:hypothetical protein